METSLLNVICGDALGSLPALPDESVQCCVTSPPYWGLRDYGCEGQLGLEKTPDEYVAKMVAVFREVRRVLKADGTFWLNLGDSYATGAGAVKDCPGGGAQGRAFRDKYWGKHGAIGLPKMTQPNRMPIPGLKPKDLVGIPWMVAFALRADGWYLRQDIIWSKPNPMPESVTDRCTKAHEYLFLLTKSARYYYDYESVREPFTEGSKDRYDYAFGGKKSEALRDANQTGIGQRTRIVGTRKYDGSGNGSDGSKIRDHVGNSLNNPDGLRNKRSVWTVTTNPYPDAHFAIYPPDLIKPCILAGSRPGDTILDPFAGSGTTGMVALELGRKTALIELNPEYCKLIEHRCDVTPGLAM